MARTSATSAAVTSWRRISSCGASDASKRAAERQHDRAVARVVESAAAPDAVDAHDERLVLDRAGLQQRAPVVATRRGPVGDDDVAVGVERDGPELVGEAQVVADEQRAADALDLDGDALVTRGVLLVLAAVAEGMDLAVARDRTVGRGEEQRVRRQGVARLHLGRGPAHPQPASSRLLDEELRARAVERLGDALGVHREAGREHLGEHHELRALLRGVTDQPVEVREVGVAVLPHDVVLDRGDSHRANFWSRAAASSMTSRRLQHANRTSGLPACLSS